jgi:hypothetical protein
MNWGSNPISEVGFLHYRHRHCVSIMIRYTAVDAGDMVPEVIPDSRSLLRAVISYKVNVELGYRYRSAAIIFRNAR